MVQARKYICAAVLLAALLFTPAGPAFANPGEPPIPEGFRLVLSDLGVALYQKDYQGGKPDYVQIVDLSQGAAVKLMHGKIQQERVGRGVYGGNDPKFQRQSLGQFWGQFASKNETAFCVTNGQFFRLADSPTGLAFPMKKDGVVVTDGYGITEYTTPGFKLMLELWEDRADIVELSSAALYNSSAPNIIAGLSEDANKRAKQYAGRTFFGVDDRDLDGIYETVLVYNTLSAVQVEAAETLRSFGADKVMMLDGGGSAMLSCQGNAYVNSERLVPQAIGIAAGMIPALGAAFSELPSWPVLVEGEGLEVALEIENSGSQAWTPGEQHLVIERKPWASNEILELPAGVAPGEKASFTWEPPAFKSWGIYVTRWKMQGAGGEKFAGHTGHLNIVVLPAKLAGQQAELEARIAAWIAQGVEDVDRMVLDWIQTQFHPGMSESVRPAPAVDAKGIAAVKEKNPLALKLGDVIWVPLTMSPMILLLIFMINKQRNRV